MEYYAHIEGTRTQTIKEHLEGTARLAGEFAGAFGKSDWGYCCGLLHDVGKYSKAFQRRVHGEDIRVDHSTAGVQLCMEKGGLYEIMSYCIAGHHAGLPDQGGSSDAGDMPTLMGRRRKKIEDYQAYKEDIQIKSLPDLRRDGEGYISTYRSHRRRKNRCLSGLCPASRGKAGNEADYLRYSIHQHY